jgi:hypothetical protein
VAFLAGDDPGETRIIAGNIREFLALLGLCLYGLGTLTASKGPWAKDAILERKKDQPFNAQELAFRKWLKQENIKVPTAKEAEAIVRQAQQAHATFGDWLRG